MLLVCAAGLCSLVCATGLCTGLCYWSVLLVCVAGMCCWSVLLVCAASLCCCSVLLVCATGLCCWSMLLASPYISWRGSKSLSLYGLVTGCRVKWVHGACKKSKRAGLNFVVSWWQGWWVVQAEECWHKRTGSVFCGILVAGLVGGAG